jgi:superfamily II DNA/RNA helicase
MVGAETGSGKTLAYLLPLLNDILLEKGKGDDSNDYGRAMILVPNKELVQQVVRMALPLCGGPACLIGGTTRLMDEPHDSPDPATLVRLAILPGGLKEPHDFVPFRNSIPLGGSDPPVDILISTPAAVAPWSLKLKHISFFADIGTLILDEADMLLDGGYLRPLQDVLLGFRRADKLDDSHGVTKTQYIFCAATLPDQGTRSVDAYLQKKFPYVTRITMAGMHQPKHYGLKERTVWIELEGNKERMERLVEFLQTSSDQGGLKGDKTMIFLNSIDDVEGAHGALQRAGFAPTKYHAKIPLEERTRQLDLFRNDTASILVCTDLASRGLDLPGVTAVVQLQFAGNAVAHLHRMGRCGRAGQRTGRGIVFYDSGQAALIKVVQEAEEQQERMMLEGNVEDEEEETVTVKKAFSRRRGFTKKLKKQRREEE